MSGKNIANANNVAASTVNASSVNVTNVVTAGGINIGVATFDPVNVSLQLNDITKAMVVNRVANLNAIVAPANGMMVYNNTDGRFYFRNSGVWETFASSPSGKAVLSITAGAVGSTSNVNGFSLSNVGGNVVGAASGDVTISLQPASSMYPGIVLSDPTSSQIFNGDKTFWGKLTFLSTPISSNSADKVLVVDGTGNLKASSLTAGLIGNATVQVPAGTNATLSPNMFFSLVFTSATFPLLAGIKADDGVVVNFKSSNIAAFSGLTIKSVAATNDGEVTVYFEDDRNPAATGYLPLDIDNKALIITWMHKN